MFPHHYLTPGCNANNGRVRLFARVPYAFSVMLATILVTASGDAVPAEREGLQIALSGGAHFFGGSRGELELTTTSNEALQGAIGWSVTVSGRTVERGEKNLTIGTGQTAKTAIPLDIPAVREGLIVPAVLTVEFYTLPQSTTIARLQKRLWVCSDQVFAGRSNWLKALQIRLFDPAGKTRDVLKRAGIPFSETADVKSLAAGGQALLLIGEGVSWEAHQGLPAIMVKAASQGNAVLCLAPSAGQIALPSGTESGGLDARYLTLRDASVIRHLDQRLDVNGWSPDQTVASRRLVLRREHDQLLAQVTDHEEGWPWLEVGFARRGKMIICLFDVIEKWDNEPVPRVLLAGLLAYLDEGSKRTPDDALLLKGEK